MKKLIYLFNILRTKEISKLIDGLDKSNACPKDTLPIKRIRKNEDIFLINFQFVSVCHMPRNFFQITLN